MCSKSGPVVLNGVKTNIKTWGRWIEDPPTNAPETIVLIIPGNPGLTEFYSEFAEVIRSRTGYSVWILGYAGHEIVEGIPSFRENADKYGLKGQIEHKREFFKTYIPPSAKVHVVAHSIGAYMTLNLLRDLKINTAISHTHLVFPAIENLAETKNGKFMTRCIKPIVWLVCLISTLFTIFPRQLQLFLLTCYMLIVSVPRKDHLFESIIKLINPTLLRNVFFLAFDEMKIIKDRDNDVIRNNLKKIDITYAQDDGWAPRSFYEKLKSEIPDVNAKITDFEHAFVLRQGTIVGAYVADLILENNNLKTVY